MGTAAPPIFNLGLTGQNLKNMFSGPGGTPWAPAGSPPMSAQQFAQLSAAPPGWASAGLPSGQNAMQNAAANTPPLAGGMPPGAMGQQLQGASPAMAGPAPQLPVGPMPGGATPATAAMSAQMPQGSAMQQFRQQLPGALTNIGRNMQSAGAGMGPAPQMQMAPPPQSQAVNAQNALMQMGNRRLPRIY